MSHPLAIGLGANVGTDDEIVERFRAVRSILESALEEPLTPSPIYRTQPLGPVQDQPAFLNAVLVGEDPGIEPVALMAALLEIEAALGRDRSDSIPQGPRPIDLDLLLAGDAVLAMGGPAAVIVPHPRLGERAFVLRPLSDLLGPDYRPPDSPSTLAELLARATEDGLEPTPLHV